MEPQRTISISQVQAYLACPLKYRFQYIEKIPRAFRPAALAFGSSVHSAVEWFHRERMNGRTPELWEVLELFEADWRAQAKEPLVFGERESSDGLIQKGREMLRLYATEAVSGPLPVAVEDPFEVPLRDPESGQELDVTLRGIVDLIEEEARWWISRRPAGCSKAAVWSGTCSSRPMRWCSSSSTARSHPSGSMCCSRHQSRGSSGSMPRAPSPNSPGRRSSSAKSRRRFRRSTSSPIRRGAVATVNI